MPDTNKENKQNINYKVLLCACKKYIKNQKNGILLVNIKENESAKDNEKMNYIFYDTKNFEVYCFCPISIYDNTMIIKNAESKKENTDYFLVGGFDNNKKKGIIKLYKVNYGIEYDKTTIEYIQDIIFANENNNMKGFRGPISSITQSNIDGKILVTCWDGNVY